ncbi:MAG TPA: hypothetical protein VG318_18520 [Actinomycetota bacterium]|nr:hypothetical protein [Actinomycetota bacterium]
MNDVERRLKQLGENAGRELPAEMRPRPAALRRIRTRRRLLGGSVALCAALVAVGGAVVIADPAPGRRDLPPAERTTEEPSPPPNRAERCGVPFKPTYLPPGFSARARGGSGGGGPDQPDAPVLAHFRGPTGRFVDVVVSPRFSWAQADTDRVTVLGRHATLGAIHEGYSVEFRLGRCRYELLGYGVTRAQLRDFAAGLVGTEERAGSYFGAVWPDDTLGGVRRSCARGGWSHPVFAVSEFAGEELRWAEPEVVIEERGRDEWTVAVTPERGRITEPGIEPGVRVWMREVLPGCWVVRMVSPLAQRRLTTLSVGVSDGMANIVFERYGATSASVEFGYGSYSSGTHWHRGDPAVTTLQVQGHERFTGHFLVLLRDEEGDPFTAIGRAMPPGDFAAG